MLQVYILLELYNTPSDQFCSLSSYGQDERRRKYLTQNVRLDYQNYEFINFMTVLNQIGYFEIIYDKKCV